MSGKGTILVIASSADSLTLLDGRQEPIGYYLNEMAIPVMAALEAGYEMVLATPRGNRPVVDPHSVVASHFGNSEAALQQALDFANTHAPMQNPHSFRSVIDDGLDRFVGLYAPGGHPPMVDLMKDLELGEILRHMHATSKTTALLCHGPVAIAAAIPKAREISCRACRRQDGRGEGAGRWLAVRRLSHDGLFE